MAIDIVPMAATDVEAVSGIHLAAFPGFFLSCLGRRFLRELYRALLADSDGIAYVAVESGRVLGFAAGTVRDGFYPRAARAPWFRFGAAAAAAVLRHPLLVLRV